MTAVEAQWSPAKHLILGEDPQVRAYAGAVVWLKKIELFRQGEDQRMVMQDPTAEDLSEHKVLLRRLIADGEHLLGLVHEVGMPENVEGISPDSVEATLALLRADYRGWHQPGDAMRRKQILTEAFPDVP